MQATILTTDGTEAGEIDLPGVFETPYRPDLIQRAVDIQHANRTQPYGSDPFAGKRTSAESAGAGFGRARIPRSNNRARRVPQAVGGRRAHPPKSTKEHGKSINTQEQQLATHSAIAATADADLVRERGHIVDEDVSFPIVLADEFGSINKTQDVLGVLDAIGIADDITRAENGRHVRAGRGTMRGRKYKTPSSILVVTDSESGTSRGARNLAGVTVATAREVNVRDLAPGGHAGRLTVWTESAIEEVGDR